MGTADAVSPAHSNHEFMALVRISEIANRARQSFGNVIEVFRFHAVNVHLVNNVSSI